MPLSNFITRANSIYCSLWLEVARRLKATKDLASQILERPEDFFAAAEDADKQAMQTVIGRHIKNLDRQTERTDELADQTNVHISLIFNISTLQDTKAAIEESKAANALALSLRRVIILTFVYLPLTLASVSTILGKRSLL